MSIIERETVAPELPAVLDPRVVRGAELLDERLPGWADKIDVDRLNMLCVNNCVLGQLYGEYVDGLRALNLDTGATHGFYWDGWLDSLRPPNWTSLVVADSGLRGQDWRLAILARQTP